MSIVEMSAILLVEDNGDDSVLAEIEFSRGDLANPIVSLSTGKEALDYLCNPHIPLPVLILLDLDLPDMAGIEVIRAIKDNGRTWSIPVIVLTGDSDAEAIATAAGAAGYLTKPLDLAAFLTASREAGLCWMIMRGSG